MTQPVYLDYYKLYAQLVGVWTDITAYLIRDIDGEWGMGGNGPLDLLARTGTMDIVLNNDGANLIPEMPGALTGWKKGIGVKLVLYFEGVPYVRFKGTVKSIKPGNGLFGHLRVNVHVTDWLEYAAEHPVVNPGVLANQRGDDVIQTALGLMPIQPAATELDTGMSVFPTTFDTVTSHTKTYAEFGKVAFSEPGAVYLRKDKFNGETLVFEAANHRGGWKPLSQIEKAKADSGFLQKEDDGYLLKEDGGRIILNQAEEFFADNNMMSAETEYGERVINLFNISANPRRIDASAQVLFKLDAPVAISGGQTIVLKGTYADPAGGLPINGQNMITPATPGDYLANTMFDSSGADLSADLIVTPSYGGEGFRHLVKNNSLYKGWITKFNYRGYGIYRYNPISHAEEDANSIAEFSTQSESMDQKYQNALLHGRVYAATVVEEERSARMILNKVTFIANRSNTLMMAFLNGDIGLYFRCANDEKGIDDLYYVQGVRFKIKPGGYIMFTWNVKKMVSLILGLSQIAVEFGGYPTTDAVNFGHIPAVSNLQTRTVSAWVNTDSASAAQSILSIFGDSAGFRFYLNGTNSIPGQQSVSFRSKVSGNTGQWIANDVFAMNQWTHLVITYDVSVDIESAPLLYVNSALEGWDTNSPGAGTFQDESGVELIVGNENNASHAYDRTFNGTIKDVRVYNRILSATEVAILYNGGTPDASVMVDGLVFQAFTVRTKDLPLFVDQPLTDSMKLLDNIQRVVGTPHGAPVGRNP